MDRDVEKISRAARRIEDRDVGEPFDEISQGAVVILAGLRAWAVGLSLAAFAARRF